MVASNQLLPDIYVPTFEMKVEGDTLKPEIAKTILEITITEYLSGSSSFSFRLNDPKLEFIQKKDGLFNEGKKVEISIGYVGSKSNNAPKTRKMIVGKITALTADFPNSGPATLEVQGYDLSYCLTHGTYYRKYDPPTSDSEIVKDIASKKIGLRTTDTSIDSTPQRTEPRVQDNITNQTFLDKLAQANGYFHWVEDDTLYFKRNPPEPKQPKQPKQISLEWGKTLISFSPRLSTAGQVHEIQVLGRDQNQQQGVSGSAKRTAKADAILSSTGKQAIDLNSNDPSKRVIADASVSSEQEAKTRAESLQNQQEQRLITSYGNTVGDPNLQVGTVLKLSGLGRFNGEYTATQVTHTIGEQGYQTSFHGNGQFYGDDFEAADGDRHRRFGVVIGIVKDNKLNNKDSDKQGRVQVEFPGWSKDEIGHWARIATLMAGDQRGTFFLPEVGDEVLVAFEQGDVTRPYIIGTLWNGKDMPPDDNANGKNNLRFIKSRSGHLIRLDDTKDSEKIEIIDKTGKNQLIFDTANNTITIKSDKDISLEASQGTIKLSAKNIEITSSAETKIQAKGLTLDGSPNDTTIKGKTIYLN